MRRAQIARVLLATGLRCSICGDRTCATHSMVVTPAGSEPWLLCLKCFLDPVRAIDRMQGGAA